MECNLTGRSAFALAKASMLVTQNGTPIPWTYSHHSSPIALMIRKQEPLKELGERIRHLRLEKELSQEEFAHLAEIDRSYVGQIERGERNISFKNLWRIATALGVSVSELTEGI